MPRSLRLAAFVLCFALPLWYSPLTLELGPQKDVLFALGLVFAASAAGLYGALALAVGLGLALAFPAGAHEILPLAALPLLVGFFWQTWAVPSGVQWLWRGALVVCVLAVLQGLGAPLFEGSSRAFALPYRVLTGPLGNPNHLSAFVLLAGATWLALRARAPASLTWRDWLWLGLLGSVLLWSRSYLGWIALACGLLVGARRRALLCLVPVALLLWRWQGLASAFEGRRYLAAVHLSALEPGLLLFGIGPGEQAVAFLHWQAAYLQAHPGEVARWTFPEYAHNDLLALVITWGAPLCLVGGLLVARALRWREGLPRPARVAALVVLALLALGGTVLYVSVLATLGAALLAASTEPRREAVRRSWMIGAARLAAVGWLLVTGARAFGDFQAREATEAGIAGRHEEALARVEAARTLPFAEGRLLFLRGRILVAAGRHPEAAEALEAARQALPHPQVFQALAQAYLAQGKEGELRQLLPQWRAYAPADPTLRALED